VKLRLGYKPSYGESGVRQTHSLIFSTITLCHDNESARNGDKDMKIKYGRNKYLAVEFVAF